MKPEDESPEEFLARQFYPDNGYESPLRFRNAFVRGYRRASEMSEQDERITAWDRIARHPFFDAAFNDSPGPLIDSMIELLDKAVSLPSKGENMNHDNDFFHISDKDGDSLTLYPANSETYESHALILSADEGSAVLLTLKDVAALHKALGDHLEAHKRELPREGAVRFSGGQIAVWLVEEECWFSNLGITYVTQDSLESDLGTDWEELVVK